jgi:hypothetical protein
MQISAFSFTQESPADIEKNQNLWKSAARVLIKNSHKKIQNLIVFIVRDIFSVLPASKISVSRRLR